MREFPVFVPHGPEHLAAVVTVPDGPPRGLVLLVTGTGAPRSHRFQLWTRVCRRLAQDGLASARMDYFGSGDSTGRVVERRMGQLELRIDEASAVARFALEALGMNRLATMGNCSGGLVAMGVAARSPSSVGTVCILPRVLQPNRVNQVVIGLRGSWAASVVRSSRFLRRLTQPLRGRKGKPRSVVQEWFGTVLARGPLLFVYSKKDADAYNEESMAQIRRMLGPLPREQRDRLDVQVLEDGPLSGFESLEIQRQVIDIVAGFAASCFPTEPGQEIEAPAASAAS
jgi:dienelactone hydrolase